MNVVRLVNSPALVLPGPALFSRLFYILGAKMSFQVDCSAEFGTDDLLARLPESVLGSIASALVSDFLAVWLSESEAGEHDIVLVNCGQVLAMLERVLIRLASASSLPGGAGCLIDALDRVPGWRWSDFSELAIWLMAQDKGLEASFVRSAYFAAGRRWA